MIRIALLVTVSVVCGTLGQISASGQDDLRGLGIRQPPQRPTPLIDDTSLLPVVQQDGQSPEPIIYGGELPRGDAETDSKNGNSSFADAINVIAQRISDLPESLAAKSRWVRQSEPLAAAADRLTNDGAQDENRTERITTISRLARGLEMELSRSLREGLPSDHFADVKAIHQDLIALVEQQVRPMEQEAGIQVPASNVAPLDNSPVPGSTYFPGNQTLPSDAYPTPGRVIERPMPYSSLRPPAVRPWTRDGTDPLYRRPGFQFRLDISPGLGYGYRYGDGLGYRSWGNGPYGLNGYRYSPYDSFGYRSYGFGSSLYDRSYRYRGLSIPYLPPGFGRPPGVGFSPSLYRGVPSLRYGRGRYGTLRFGF